MILCGSGKEDVTRQVKGTDDFYNDEVSVISLRTHHGKKFGVELRATKHGI